MAFDFSARDYSTIKQELLLRASTATPDWTDRDPSDFGMLMVDLWAYFGDVLHYYVDLVAQETFIETATQRESVLAYANLFDYTPNYRTSATATVTLANSGASVGIPASTEFVANYDNKYYYYYTTAGASVPSSGTATVTVTEGEQVIEEVLTTTSSGEVNQTYTLRSENIAPGSVRVYVYEDVNAPTEWQKVTSLSTVDTGVGAYRVYVNAQEEVNIIFGNRINGRIPPAGVKITATYTISSGSSGNIPANNITSFRSAVSSNLTIQSSSAASGGTDIESVASMKRSIQSLTRAQNRAVTLRDFADLSLGVSGVTKAVAAFNSGTSTVTVYPVPYVTDYTTYTSYSIAVPSSMQTEVVSKLQPLAMVGITVASASSITVNRVDITATLKVVDRYVAPWVERDVRAAIADVFSFDNMYLGEEVRIGELYSRILSVIGVEYVTISAVTIKDSSNNTVTSLPATTLLRLGTVNLSVTGGISTS